MKPLDIQLENPLTYNERHNIIQEKIIEMMNNSIFISKGIKWRTVRLDIDAEAEDIINNDKILDGNYCTIHNCVFKNYKTQTVVVPVPEDIQELIFQMLNIRVNTGMDIDYMFIINKK